MGGGNEYCIMTSANDLVSQIFDRYEQHNETLIASLQFWEKKRIIFNGVLFIAGVVGIPYNEVPIDLITIIGVPLYAVAANLCYCSGYLLESQLTYYSKGRFNLVTSRNAFFIAGTAFSAILTFALLYLEHAYSLIKAT